MWHTLTNNPAHQEELGKGTEGEKKEDPDKKSDGSSSR